MTDSRTVLIIDEVPELVRLLGLELKFEGFRPETVLLEEDVVGRAMDVRPDAIIIGSVIPTPHMFELLTSLRDRTTVPIVFISSTGNEGDSAVALQMGASEVINRPFLPNDLVLRLHALLDEEFARSSLIGRGSLTIDVLHRLVFQNEAKVTLATNEWSLLLALAEADRNITASDLLVRVWGSNYAADSRFLEIWIRRLQINLHDDPTQPHIILGNVEDGFWLAP